LSIESEKLELLDYKALANGAFGSSIIIKSGIM